jgi:UPF0176 acylphosphatase like domain
VGSSETLLRQAYLREQGSHTPHTKRPRPQVTHHYFKNQKIFQIIIENNTHTHTQQPQKTCAFFIRCDDGFQKERKPKKGTIWWMEKERDDDPSTLRAQIVNMNNASSVSTTSTTIISPDKEKKKKEKKEKKEKKKKREKREKKKRKHVDIDSSGEAEAAVEDDDDEPSCRRHKKKNKNKKKAKKQKEEPTPSSPSSSLTVSATSSTTTSLKVSATAATASTTASTTTSSTTTTSTLAAPAVAAAVARPAVESSAIDPNATAILDVEEAAAAAAAAAAATDSRRLDKESESDEQSKKKKKKNDGNRNSREKNSENDVTLLLFYQYVDPPWTEKEYKHDVLPHVPRLAQQQHQQPQPQQQPQQPQQQPQAGLDGLTGRMRVAREGLNCTLTGSRQAILSFCRALRHWKPECFNATEFKLTHDLPRAQRFREFKVIPVTELVHYGLNNVNDPVGPIRDLAQYSGTHLEPRDYHKLLATDHTVVIDVRNHYEAAIGRFVPPCSTTTTTNGQDKTATGTGTGTGGGGGGATFLDPNMRKSTEFPLWLDDDQTKEQLRNKKVLMYCTGTLVSFYRLVACKG